MILTVYARIEIVDGEKEGLTVRLPDFLQLVRLVAFLIIVVFLFLVWRFPSYFDFIVEPGLFLAIMLAFSIINPIFSYFVPRLVKSMVFYSAYLYNILWAVFITGLLYALGGIRNYLGIMLVFPILTTAFDLEARAAVTLGVITEVLFASLMFFDRRVPHTGSYYVAGSVFMLFIGLFSYYLYSIIKEGVRQRFEKEEAKRKYFDLAEIDKAKTEFMTVTSHQLQTPLSELRWALNGVLEAKRWNEDVENILKKSSESVAKLVDIVRSLIQTSQLERPELEYKRTPIDVSKTIDSILKDLKNLIAQKGVVVSFQAAHGEFVVNGDPERLRNAILNIIDNAIKYSPGGKVKISLAKEQNGVKTVVSDTGIGISPQEQPQIFTKFFRASNAIKLDPNETGVGLYIAKNIIEKHRGTIDFISEPGKGTTFTIFIPFLPIESKK